MLLLACNLLEVHPVNNCTHFLRQILHFHSWRTVRAEGSMPGAEGQRVTGDCTAAGDYEVEHKSTFLIHFQSKVAYNKYLYLTSSTFAISCFQVRGSGHE